MTNNFQIATRISCRMPHNIGAHKFQLLKKDEVGLKEAKIGRNKMNKTLLMMNICRLRIKSINKKEGEAGQKVLRTKRRIWEISF